MLKQSIIAATIVATSLLSLNSSAFKITNNITTSIVTTNPDGSIKGKKDVVVMGVGLNQKQQNRLMRYQPKRSIHHDANLPTHINLGMNGTPVLNQGRHGSCVTFATSGAINAVLGRGDYVSQLCSLELGNHLEDTGYFMSGWNGSYGPWVLDQMTRFGIVSKDAQKAGACGSLLEYPTYDENNTGSALAANDYKMSSEDINEKLYWIPLMNSFERFDSHFKDDAAAENVLQRVKQALNKGHRLTFGTFLVLSPYCSAGACAKHNATNDTWALTRDLTTPPFYTGGHEMIITGYDDTAFATDSDGLQHFGLLTLRNSWGTDAGDQGNYYMSYDYFKKFTMEVQEIVS